MQPWISLVETLIWPITLIVLAILLRLHKHLPQLLARTNSLKVGNVELRLDQMRDEILNNSHALQNQGPEQAAHTRILWVDDYPENNEDEIKQLQAKGFWVETTRKTNTAMARLQAMPFDRVISDMGRTEYNVDTGRPEHREYAGLELLEQMQKDFKSPPPVLFYTSEAQVTSKGNRVRQMGAQITADTNELMGWLEELTPTT